MFEYLRRELRLLAIKRSLRKRAPSSFPYSPTNNYYVPTLTGGPDNQSVLVDEITGCSVVGRLWTGEKYSDHIKVPICELQNWEVKISRFYGYLQEVYGSTLRFWLAELTLTTERRWFYDRLFQSYYNATLVFRNDRIEVLKTIIEAHYKEALVESTPALYQPKKKSILRLQDEHFGNRIYSHPKYKEIVVRFRLLIDSLAESGDLKKHGKNDFVLCPKALVTISEYANEERRHRDNVWHNRLIFVLTLVLAAAACVTAYSDWNSPSGWFASLKGMLL